MKKLVKILTNGALIAVALEILLCILALFGGMAKLYLNPTSLLLLILFSFLISASLLLFGIKRFPLFLKALFNYITVFAGFVLFLLLGRKNSLKESDFLFGFVAYTVVYLIIFFAILGIKKAKAKKQ